MMNRLIKRCALFLLVLGVQGCTTSGGPPSGANALPANPTAGQGVPPRQGAHGAEGENRTRGDNPSPRADMFGIAEENPSREDKSLLRTETSATFVPAIIGIPADPGPMRAHRIGPYDLLKIEVFQVDELATEQRVSEEGSIIMPLIGNLKVRGLTPREAEQVIADRLGERYLNDPQVSVLVAESTGHKVTILGHVKSPGVFPLVGGQTTLMQAIAMAGGLDEIAKKEEIVVFRKQERGDINAYVVNLALIEKGQLTDPVMISDDRVVVPKSGTAVVKRTVGHVLTNWILRIPLPY